MEMKPFDLERARAGDPVVCLDGTLTHFVGLSSSGYPVIETHGLTRTVFTTDLRMASKETTYWVPVFRDTSGEPYFGAAYRSFVEAERDIRYERYEAIIPITLQE
jgi:hypothetical protein